MTRDQLPIGFGLAAITALGWIFLVRDMDSGTICMLMMSPSSHRWSMAEFGAVFGMWSIMMVAMMIPSASPMILLFATVNRRRQMRGTLFVPTAIFVAGYLVVWTAFSLLATLVQGFLQWAELVTSSMVSASPVLTGVLLILCGLFQWTPLKRRCLEGCSTPLAFMTTHWREGKSGAFTMGLHHGALCVGCCWALMGLLFVAGVMNLWWIGLLSLVVLAEKLAPRVLSKPLGPLLVAGGIWFLI